LALGCGAEVSGSKAVASEKTFAGIPNDIAIAIPPAITAMGQDAGLEDSRRAQQLIFKGLPLFMFISMTREKGGKGWSGSKPSFIGIG
jgi:hypothetical protein